MKCVLVRCPQMFGKYVTAAPAVPPIGLAYVAASLREAGHDVRVIDATGEAIDSFQAMGGATLRRGLTDAQILERIGKEAELVGFSLMFSQDWLPARALIGSVRAAFPKATLVGGGEHFSAEPVGALEDSALDFVVAGEGDRVLCDLVEHLEGRKAIDEVPSVYFRSNGEIRESHAMLRVKDLDSLPWPAWDLIPVENYLSGRHGWGVDRGRSMPLNATRGCPYQCTFCSSPKMWTTRWVARSPEDVVREIEEYIERYDASNFDFQDLTAILKKQWIIDFAKLLLAKNLEITWQLPTGTRSEALDEEVLPLLCASGCTNITYAPESGSEEILEKIKKKISREKMIASMRAAVKAGCNVKANFIFGFPGDTYRSYAQTFGFFARAAVAGVHDISIAPFRPYPGSELFRDLQKRGLLPAKLDDDYYETVFRTSENLPTSSMPKAESFCENMSPRGLDRLRVAGLAWFFLISWALRPQRVFKLIHALVTDRQDSRLDKSLIEMKRRVLKTSRGEESLRVGEINPY